MINLFPLLCSIAEYKLSLNQFCMYGHFTNSITSFCFKNRPDPQGSCKQKVQLRIKALIGLFRDIIIFKTEKLERLARLCTTSEMHSYTDREISTLSLWIRRSHSNCSDSQILPHVLICLGYPVPSRDFHPGQFRQAIGLPQS